MNLESIKGKALVNDTRLGPVKLYARSKDKMKLDQTLYMLKSHLKLFKPNHY